MKRPDVTLWHAVTLAVAIVLDILVFVPFLPLFPQDELDSSWKYATNYGLIHKLQFGKELLFTSGPLAFIYTRQYYPSLFALMLGLSVIVIVALTIGYWFVARRSRRTLILVLPLLLAQAPDFDAVFLLLPLLLFWVACQATDGRAKTMILVLLTVVCALLPLIKGSFAFNSVMLLAGVVLIEWLHRPVRAATLLSAYTGTLALAWLACGQAPATFVAYAKAEALIISGYTDAMSLPGPATEPILFTIAAASILALGRIGLHRRPLLSLAALAVTLFFCLKTGFVRQDGHVLIATSGLLLAGYLVTLAGRGKGASLALPLSLAAWCLISWPYAPVDTLSALARATEAVERSAGAIEALAADRGSARKSFEASLGEIRARHPLDGIAGAVDLYPANIAIVLANGRDWDPRPIIQSYSAYTNTLAALNAASLARPGTPDTILFQVATIDDRYPALDDAPSWPILAARYRPVGIRGDYVELEKRAIAATTTIEAPIADREALIGEKIEIPPGPIWAEIDVTPSLPGRLVSAMYKLPLLTITLDYADGSSKDFRFIASMGSAGFLLSPTVGKATALLALESDVTLGFGAVPVTFSIGSDDPTGRLWHTRYHVKLHPIAFPQAADIDRLLLIALRPSDESLPSSFEGDCVVDAVAQQEGSDIALGKGVGALNVRGWAMMSVAEGRANRDLAVAFIPDGGGAIFTADLPKIASPGLAEHFGTPAAGNAAFDADIDVRMLPAGRYYLQLVQDGGAGRVRCHHRDIVVERR